MAGAKLKRPWPLVACLCGLTGLLLVGVAGASAQEPGRGAVTGRVTAEVGSTPLGGVRVDLVEAGRGVLTDGLGRFRFRDVVPGEYTLRFSLIGHGIREESVRVAEGSQVEHAVNLGTDPVVLDQLLVLLNRTRLVGSSMSGTDIPGSAHVLGMQRLEERKILFDDVHQLLREVPGVHVQEEDGFGLRPNIGMRGASSDRSSKITLMEDGVLIAPAPYSAPAAYYFPVAGRMEAIEVRKGSSQIRHGPITVGGAINLVSSNIPSAFSVLVDAAGGERSTRKLRVRAGDSSERFGWLLETYQLGTKGFKQLDGGGGTGFDVQDYVAKVRVNTALGAPHYQELQLKLGYYDERSDETYLGLTAEDFALTPLRRYAGSQADLMRADQWQANLRHFARVGGLDLTTTAYYTEFNRNWYKLQSVGGKSLVSVLDAPESNAELLAILGGGESATDALRVRANNRGYYSRGIQTALGWSTPAVGGHDIEVGVRYHQDAEDRFQHEDGYAMHSGAMGLTSKGAPGSQENRVNDASAWSAYVQDRFEIGALSVSPGLRYENIAFQRRDYTRTDPERANDPTLRENSVSVLIPGIGVSYALSPSARLFGGVHRGFAPPGPGANEETRPEYSINYEVGTRLSSAVAQVQAVGFISPYTNILGAETLASGTEGTGNLYNGGAVDVWGVELSATTEVPGLDRWRLPVTVSYTYTHAAFKTSFRSDYEAWGTVTAGDRLPYMPEHQLFASGGMERGGFKGGLTANHVSAMRTVAGTGAIPADQGTDRALVLGASGEYEMGRSTTLYGGVENLTDARYIVARRPAGLRPGLPRTLQLGLRVTR